METQTPDRRQYWRERREQIKQDAQAVKQVRDFVLSPRAKKASPSQILELLIRLIGQEPKTKTATKGQN